MSGYDLAGQALAITQCRQSFKVVLDGMDANLEMVKQGCAWHYKQYAREQSAEDVALYAQAEQGARASHLGLWKDAQPIPPWDYRAAKRNH